MTVDFPMILKVAGRGCVVVGGGEVALRKATALVECGARVRVISPELGPELAALAARGAIEWEARGYRPGDLAGAFLCVAAADDAEVNAAVKQEARECGVLANLADDPDGSDYQVPSFFADGDLLIAVSTGGASPAVARTLRRMIQSYLGPSFGDALKIISDFRDRVKQEIADPKRRGRFWEEAITAEALEKVRAGDLAGLRQILEESLARFRKETAE